MRAVDRERRCTVGFKRWLRSGFGWVFVDFMIPICPSAKEHSQVSRPDMQLMQLSQRRTEGEGTVTRAAQVLAVPLDCWHSKLPSPPSFLLEYSESTEGEQDLRVRAAWHQGRDPHFSVTCEYLSTLLTNQPFFLLLFEQASLKVSFPRVLVTRVPLLVRASLGAGGVMFNVLQMVVAIISHRLPGLLWCWLFWEFHQIIPGKIKYDNKVTFRK